MGWNILSLLWIYIKDRTKEHQEQGKIKKAKRYENLKNKKRIMLSIQSTTDDQFQVHADNIICNWFLNIVNTIIIN